MIRRWGKTLKDRNKQTETVHAVIIYNQTKKPQLIAQQTHPVQLPEIYGSEKCSGKSTGSKQSKVRQHLLNQ